MTDLQLLNHSTLMSAATATESFVSDRKSGVQSPLAELDFETIYDVHFDFVWRSLRRLGVPEANLEDAQQDVFLVVHRRLSDFEARSSTKTWIFGIALRVASDYRRKVQRRREDDLSTADELMDQRPSPHEQSEKFQAVELLDKILSCLDDDKRVVFILAELEQMTVPEIVRVLGVNVNTVYSRLRAARIEFEANLARCQRRFL